ncbi:MAG: hypothetical protein AMXMBFR61_03340 [Fimbriimonadales bacterium]
MKAIAYLLALTAACPAAAQTQIGGQIRDDERSLAVPKWEHTSLGRAGECYVATDDQGHVYVTGHILNGQSGVGVFYASSDWGKTFPVSRSFTSACCDFQVEVGPDGRVYVVYMTSAIDGLVCAVSDNYGSSFYQVKKVLTGPYDREWFGFRGNNIDIVYSDGYIGGPVSKGVIFSTSADGGANFSGYVRVDDEVVGSEAVDPSIACNDNITVAGWNTSTDRNTVRQFKVARSADGGQTFTNHTVLATYDSAIGDTQERWLAQIPIVSAPNDTFIAVYQNYANVMVDGQPRKALLLYYRRSRDGGLTWEPARTVAPLSDIVSAIRQYEATRWTNNSTIFPYYIQHQPWACVDPHGDVHVVWFDNRFGQNPGVLNSKWSVYHTQAHYSSDKWEKPDAVTPEPFLCVRPNLDFIGVGADSRYVYCAWIRRINQTSTQWSFYGDMFLSRRARNSAREVPVP